MITLKRVNSIVFVAVLLLTFRAPGADWPQWRGPGRDGVWPETGLLQKFPAEKLPTRWRAEIANGYSAPTVADGRVYVTDRLTSPKESERINCFDAMTGEPLWSYKYDCRYEKVDKRDGPRAAVAIDSARAYSLGTMGHLFCFDAAKGKVLWEKDLKSQYKIKMPIWGIAASPLVEGDLLIVLIGGRPDSCLVAFDKITGRENWRALNDSASYSAPIVIEQAGKRVLLCWTGESIVGLDPKKGKLHWQYPFPPAQMVHNIAAPVFENGYLLASEFFSGSMLLKVHSDKLAVEQIWRRQGQSERLTESLHCCISTPFIRGDHIYGIDSYGELRCGRCP
ncbi:MAG: PQQ-binding-like beta-propeller repeat protein [Planctomycetota bacterium]